jgi:hypothetical protein
VSCPVPPCRVRLVTFDGAEIHLGVEPDLNTRPDRRSTAYLFVEDADALAQTWLAAGANVRLPQDAAQRRGAAALPLRAAGPGGVIAAAPSALTT